MKAGYQTLAMALVSSALSGGCAVYGPPATYTEVRYYESAPVVYVRPAPVYVYPSPVYVRPAPVYVYPAPAYTAPPVWFGLNFQYHGGRTHKGGRRHFR
jgi:hypothetical protein